MMNRRLEQFHARAYEDVLQRLLVIESKLTDSRINFDPGWSLLDLEKSTLSTTVKSAWCIHRLIDLLRLIIKEPAVKADPKKFFPLTAFYLRLYQILPQLNACMTLLIKLQSENITDRQGFVVGVLFWELLQALNPQVLSASQSLWENLYHGSPIWHRGFNQCPRQLYSKLKVYFHRATAQEKINLLEQVRTLNFHQFLQIDITPEAIRNVLNGLQGSIQNYVHPWPLQFDSNLQTYEADNQSRIDVLTYLQAKLNPESRRSDASIREEPPISPQELEAYLERSLVNIFDCFDSSITNNSTYTYLRPADKLKFIFDGIVLKPTEDSPSALTEVGSLIYEFGTIFVPRVTNFFTATSPGTAYIQKRLPSYTPIEFNERFYNSISIGSIRKKQYQKDGAVVLQNLIDCWNQETVLKNEFVEVQQRITEYHRAREELFQKILTLTQLMSNRVTQIENFNDSSAAIKQYEETYRNFFGQSNLEQKCQELNSLKAAIKPLVTVELKENSRLEKDVKKLNLSISNLLAQDNILGLYNQFKELLEVTQRYETQYQNEQSRFVFPVSHATYRVKFPYFSLLGLICAAIGLALSAGIMLGNPYFTFLVLPVLIDYTIPLCLVLAGVSTAAIVKTSLDLMRYRFFVAAQNNSSDASLDSNITLQI